MSDRKLRRGDPVTYHVWQFDGQAWAQVARDAEVHAVVGAWYPVKVYERGQVRTVRRQVRRGQVRLITDHDGGKIFNLPMSEVTLL